jgi:C4-dicarboxylate transporter
MDKNNKISNKELLFFIIDKLDEIDEKINKDRVEVAKIKTQIKIFWFMLPIAVSLAAIITSLL